MVFLALCLTNFCLKKPPKPNNKTKHPPEKPLNPEMLRCKGNLHN